MSKLRPRTTWLFAIPVALSLIFGLFISFTPWVEPRLGALTRVDPYSAADAIVVLSSGVTRSGKLDAIGRARLIHALQLLKEARAPQLIRTRLPSWYKSPAADVANIALALGIRDPFLEVGPVSNTHDEALLTRELAHSRGWKKIILVTSPWHSRRAAAVFEKTGLEVISRPDGEIPFSTSPQIVERWIAMKHWLRESLAIIIYHWRDWL